MCLANAKSNGDAECDADRDSKRNADCYAECDAHCYAECDTIGYAYTAPPNAKAAAYPASSPDSVGE